MVVQIRDIGVQCSTIDRKVKIFAVANGLKSPKHVAYTIFPSSLARNRNRRKIFDLYNKKNGVFDRIRTGWGTYFRRMTHYATSQGCVNQLERILIAIRRDIGRGKAFSAAYSMTIPVPGSENSKPRGSPCLNYIAIQIQKGSPDKVGMLAVYRNHEFCERAYGNYLGLCQLLRFIADETGCQAGPLTCISSHAYVNANKNALRALLKTL